MLLFLLMLPRSPISTLFPYTTLFRSLIEERVGVEAIALEGDKQGAGSQVSGVRGDAAEAESGRRAHAERFRDPRARPLGDRKSTRLNSSHTVISYAVFCLKKKTRAIE